MLSGAILLALIGFGVYAAVGGHAGPGGSGSPRGETLPAVLWLVATLGATVASALWVLMR